MSRKRMKKKLRKVKRKKTTTPPPEEVMTPPWESAVKELGTGQTITPWTPPAPVVPARTAEEMTRGAALSPGEFAHNNENKPFSLRALQSIINFTLCDDSLEIEICFLRTCSTFQTLKALFTPWFTPRKCTCALGVAQR